MRSFRGDFVELVQCASSGIARQHRQDRLCTVERLDLAQARQTQSTSARSGGERYRPTMSRDKLVSTEVGALHSVLRGPHNLSNTLFLRPFSTSPIGNSSYMHFFAEEFERLSPEDVP